MPRVNVPKKSFSGVAFSIKNYAAEVGMSIADVANRIGVCPATMYSKLRKPESLTLSEIKKISVVLNAPLSVLMEVAKKG